MKTIQAEPVNYYELDPKNYSWVMASRCAYGQMRKQGAELGHFDDEASLGRAVSTTALRDHGALGKPTQRTVKVLNQLFEKRGASMRVYLKGEPPLFCPEFVLPEVRARRRRRRLAKVGAMLVLALLL